jgi:predicted enzyme related to lactoylglutathione lyase
VIRTVASWVLALMVLGAWPPAARAADPAQPTVPPLTEPASGEHLPGKLVWADLFTSDPAMARRFYAGVFGWEWRWVSERPGRGYGMFYADGIPVAGVAQHAPKDPATKYARWVHFISVEDVATSVAATIERGGRTLLARRDVAQRGTLAVLADPEDAPFGVLRSSSGDPPDYRAEIGEWLWVGLYARDSGAAARFYADVFGYEIHERDDHPEVIEFALASGGYSRAGVDALSEGSSAHPTWLGFVRVEDVAATLDKVRALGGEVLYEPEEGDLQGELAIVADPFGAPVGLMYWDFEDEGSGPQEVRP